MAIIFIVACRLIYYPIMTAKHIMWKLVLFLSATSKGKKKTYGRWGNWKQNADSSSEDEKYNSLGSTLIFWTSLSAKVHFRNGKRRRRYMKRTAYEEKDALRHGTPRRKYWRRYSHDSMRIFAAFKYTHSLSHTHEIYFIFASELNYYKKMRKE